jgi:hypothetical protein
MAASSCGWTGRAAERVESLADNDEVLFLVERDRPRIVGIDVEVEPARREMRLVSAISSVATPMPQRMSRRNENAIDTPSRVETNRPQPQAVSIDGNGKGNGASDILNP